MEDLKYFIRQSQGFRAGAGKAGKGMMRERESTLSQRQARLLHASEQGREHADPALS